MALKIYNTRTRSKERFESLHPNVVRLYTCGLTVYSQMHIGHARTYLFWDFLRRYLEYRYYQVISVVNYTDIDDRIMGRADDETGCVDLAESIIASFRRDCRALRIKDYSAYTRATDYIDAQVSAVAALIERGHAYVVDGEVFYSVESFPRYGQLSGMCVHQQQAGASGRLSEDASRKRNPADFTLWKPSGEGQPSWSTGQPTWPSGRPGWHIECTVMATALLGEKFDIHGGAIDNLFPHHENEIAQAEPLCGSPWVRYWMHPEHLDLRGEKMSKSLGNVVAIPELLAQFGYDEVRWFLASTHYRTKLQFSPDLVAAAAEGYKKITRLFRRLESRLEALPDDQLNVPIAGDYATLRDEPECLPRDRHRLVHGQYGEASTRFIDRFIAACDDDLGTPTATAAVFDYVNELNAGGIDVCEDAPSLLAVYRTLARHLHVLGIEYPNERLYPELAVDCQPLAEASSEQGGADVAIDRLVALRQAARKAKQFDRADQLRDVLSEIGVSVEDTPDGPRWSVDA
ncbi:MAG: cysteine--tRNA ligase [Myxococcales bacterium FL481]|nr:MAG: cysteine--tRNA ligase [Myxococcales bacterium FL481]